MYSYSQILKQAFKIAKTYPGLWIFGLLAAALGSAGEIQLFFGGLQFSEDSTLLSFWQGLAQGGFFSLSGIKGLLNSLAVNPAQTFFIIFEFLIVVGASTLAIWLIIVAQTALIAQSIVASKAKPVSFWSGWALGVEKFFPVLGINLVLRAVGWGLIVVAGGLALFNFSGANFLYIIAFDVFLVLLLLASFTAKLAICGVALRGWKFQEALARGYALFKNNWLVVGELAVVLFVIYFLVNSISFYLISQVFLYSLVVFGGSTFMSLTVFSVLLVVFAAVQVMLAVFHWSVWAIAFELLNSPKKVLISKLKTWLGNITN